MRSINKVKKILNDILNVIKFRQYLKAGQLIIVDGAKTTLIASTHVTIGVLQDYVRDFKKLKSAEI